MKNKIKLRNVDKAMYLRVLILNLILQKRFKEAKELANKYVTPVNHPYINDYKEFKKKYDKVKPKLTEKKIKELISNEKELRRKWRF